MTILSPEAMLQFVEAEVRKISGPQKRNKKYVNVVCRFHQDTNPSLGIRIGQISDKFPAGSFKCLSCGASGRNWNKLAEAYGLTKLNKDTVIFESKASVNTDAFSKLLATDDVLTLEQVLETNRMRLVEKWPKDVEWRSFPGKFLAEIGALSVKYRPIGSMHYDKQFLFFPAYVDGDIVGGIRARLKPTSAADGSKLPSYYNTRGEWSLTKGLWPYDYVMDMLKESGKRGVLLVEGPRDALRFISLGVPTLCVLGTQSMTMKKASLIAEMPVDVVWIMGDGDEAGHKFNKLAKTLLKSLTNARVVKIPITEDRYDPCSLPEKMVRKIQKLIV